MAVKDAAALLGEKSDLPCIIHYNCSPSTRCGE
jgi:hypothetical protein